MTRGIPILFGLTMLLAETASILPPAAAELSDANVSGVKLVRTNYHGWADSWLISNGTVEGIVVPAIGRVMQFRFAGEAEGPFWENRVMDGKMPDPAAKEWGNFGGDKTWPAPQRDWPKVTRRSWPPPPAFDSMPVTAQAIGTGVTLLSPVDPFYGIRTKRLVMLDPRKPEMIIATSYEKVSGPPQTVAIWTITQLKDPAGVFLMPYPLSPWPAGYNKQSDHLPSNLKMEDRILSLTRDRREAHKIGSLTSFLLWVGQEDALKIFHARLPQANYPDQGSNAEVYTNPDPLPYVELELLGPLHEMKEGDRVSETRSYTLIHRQNPNPHADAHAILEP